MSALKWKCWNDIFFAHVVGRGRCRWDLELIRFECLRR
jgi:hypothetical protein